MRYFFAAGAVSPFRVPFRSTRRADLFLPLSLSRSRLPLQSAGILPLVRAVGVGVANTIVSGLSFFGVLLLLLVIRYGEGWAGRSPPSTKPPSLAEPGEELSHLGKGSKDGDTGELGVGGEKRGANREEGGASSRPMPLEKAFSIEPRPSG